jgi:hypothetical protein
VHQAFSVVDRHMSSIEDRADVVLLSMAGPQHIRGLSCVTVDHEYSDVYLT